MSLFIYPVGNSEVVHVRKNQMNMKTRFHLHSYINSLKESQIIMGISGNGERKRIPLGLYISRKDWDSKNQLVKKSNSNSVQLNLILDKNRAKIAEIRIHYQLLGQFLSLDKLIEEYKNKTPSYDFISFMRHELEKMPMKESSYKKHIAQINKLQSFKERIAFSDINMSLINDFKSYLAKELKNNRNTIISNLKVVKKFLRKAVKYGIPIGLDVDEIVIGSMRGNRTYLSEDELHKLRDYYNSSFIREAHKLPLGYFLFACYTGLRLSDVRKLERTDFAGKTFSFISEKTEKQQSLILNNSARQVINTNELLFDKWITDQKINSFLKEIASFCGIRKKISFHVGRHTFATNFLRKGGKVEELQVLLAHSKITTTMVYVHMIRSEQMDSIYLLDND